MVDPVACRVALFVANRTEITPNALTRLSLVLGIGAAACFAFGHLVAGALTFYVSFLVDCVDGKIARLKGTGTPFGLWLDFVGDRIREVCCAAGLAYGQYTATGRVAFILLGAGIAVLDLFRYVNGPQMKKVRQAVKARRKAARRQELDDVRDAMAVESLARAPGQVVAWASAGDPPDEPPPPYQPPPPYDPPDYSAAVYELPDYSAAAYELPGYDATAGRGGPGPYDWAADTGGGHPDPEPGLAPDGGPVVPRQAGAPLDAMIATRPFARVPRHDPPEFAPPARYRPPPPRPPEPDPRPGARRLVQEYLARHRVRSHLMSGIEFHAAVFVVAPLLGPAALIPVTIGAGALLVANETYLVYRMWQATRAPGAPDRAGEPAREEPQVRTDPFYTEV
ncbi:hypothetical protein Sru01_05830 [Sphaerisporangium rufum]|uniref:CDP-alcohol phosphatidyltransferase n=2 Tax=Sphaerisporangium rufum TaxID=1381558 RepID=A0A919QZF5_9ACTN|nr:hypothetical protein Sru01_05830 [Sphaerisporangium rufum]